MVEQLADRHLGRDPGRRQPVPDGVVERQAPFLDELEDERRQERLGDAADRERGPGVEPGSAPVVGPAADAGPGAAVRPDDRGRHTGQQVLDPDLVEAGLERGRGDGRRLGVERGRRHAGRWSGRAGPDGAARRRDRRGGRGGRAGGRDERRSGSARGGPGDRFLRDGGRRGRSREGGRDRLDRSRRARVAGPDQDEREDRGREHGRKAADAANRPRRVRAPPVCVMRPSLHRPACATARPNGPPRG